MAGWTTAVLRWVAERLRRWADRVLETAPPPPPPLEETPDGPPAHWLAKVRAGAPHLLAAHGGGARAAPDGRASRTQPARDADRARARDAERAPAREGGPTPERERTPAPGRRAPGGPDQTAPTLLAPQTAPPGRAPAPRAPFVAPATSGGALPVVAPAVPRPPARSERGAAAPAGAERDPRPPVPRTPAREEATGGRGVPGPRAAPAIDPARSHPRPEALGPADESGEAPALAWARSRRDPAATPERRAAAPGARRIRDVAFEDGVDASARSPRDEPPSTAGRWPAAAVLGWPDLPPDPDPEPPDVDAIARELARRGRLDREQRRP